MRRVRTIWGKAVGALAVGTLLSATAFGLSGAAAEGPDGSRAGSGVGSTAAGSERTAPDRPTVSGSGRIYFDDDDDRIFTFDASGLALDGFPPDGVPGTTGTFSVAHYTDPGHENGVEFSGYIDCLVVGGRTATFTGVIEDAVAFGEGVPDVSGLIGVRRGFSVTDTGPGRPDRLGFSWFIDAGDTTSVQPCQAPAPFAYVDEGDFDTTEWLPPQLIPRS